MSLENNAQSGLFFITAGAVFLVAVLAGLFVLTAPPTGNETTTHTSLAHFANYEELLNSFQKAQNYYSTGNYRDSVSISLPMLSTAAGSTKTAQSESGTGTTATDYSKTNIQVEGVDEADIIKNDGKYVYAIANGELHIIDAFPAENAKIISTIDLNGATPNEIFISNNSDKLVVFANGGGYPVYYSGIKTQTKTASFATNTVASKMMPWRGNNNTSVLVFDIQNKEAPTLEKQLDFDGTYLNSRLIGKYVYFVVNSYPNYNTPCVSNSNAECTADDNSIIPIMRINGVESRIAKPTEIGVMPRVRPTSFITIGSLDLENLDFAREIVAGAANNLYASQNNLFLAEPVWEYSDYNGPIPLEIGLIAKSIYFPNISTTEKTTISKFSLENGKVSFAGEGTALGHILNQFSMDEYKDNFRIATTVGEVWNEGANASKNNVYIFDEEMKMVGALEGLAPGEKIYSARFLGDKAYMVTFKKVDPLFVLDLSKPENPKILGKLKIPGYSDYLHPIDENHLIGIGKDAIESDYGTFAWYQGMKIAIFDVTDVANPKEMHKIVIGDRGTNSEALSDHKAFLYDKEKNLLVIPITLAEIQNKDSINPAAEKSSPTYGEQTFQGAMVFNVTLENGFVEKGRITHVSADEELKRGYYYDYTSQIKRSLFMDNVLYTFSEKMLKANDLETLEKISEVSFPQNQNNYSYGYE